MSMNTKIQILGVIALMLSPFLGLLHCPCGASVQASDTLIDTDRVACCETSAIEPTCCRSEESSPDAVYEALESLYCTSSSCSCACNTSSLLFVAINRSTQCVVHTPSVGMFTFDTSAESSDCSASLSVLVPSYENPTHLLNCVFLC